MIAQPLLLQSFLAEFVQALPLPAPRPRPSLHLAAPPVTAPARALAQAPEAPWGVGAAYGCALVGCLLCQFVFNEQMFFLGERLALQPPLVDRRPCTFEGRAPSARLMVPCGARAARAHPTAQPEQLGSSPWPPKPASGRPNEMDCALATPRQCRGAIV